MKCPKAMCAPGRSGGGGRDLGETGRGRESSCKGPDKILWPSYSEFSPPHVSRTHSQHTTPAESHLASPVITSRTLAGHAGTNPQHSLPETHPQASSHPIPAFRDRTRRGRNGEGMGDDARKLTSSSRFLFERHSSSTHATSYSTVLLPTYSTTQRCSIQVLRRSIFYRGSTVLRRQGRVCVYVYIS